MTLMRVACLQMAAGESPERNLSKAVSLIGSAKRKEADLACLPEMFHYRGDPRKYPCVAQTLSSPFVEKFRRLARELRMGILLGSFLEKPSHAGKYYNTSVLISKDGGVKGVYRKIHRFDICLRGKMSVSESKYILAGRKAHTAFFSGVKTGMSICYDLRFPELYRKLAFQGAEVLFVPSNFTALTGRAHWETLLRARAIENQAFVVAPAQVGTNPYSRIPSYGDSLIIDPWGKILAEAGPLREEIITADLDFARLKRFRREFPVLNHARAPLRIH